MIFWDQVDWENPVVVFASVSSSGLFAFLGHSILKGGVMQKSEGEIRSLVNELIRERETEWVEFKCSNAKPEMIGEYISALSNSALAGKVNAYMVWGVDNDTRRIVGTSFDPRAEKVGNEELENWLLRGLTPKINFRFHHCDVDGKAVVLLEIGAAFRHPVRFKKVEYIRVGSYKKVLKDFPEIERELWRTFDRVSFEEGAAASRVEVGRVLELLDYVSYFELLELPPPESHASILDALEADRMICRDGDLWNITNMGAILFAKRLGEFPTLSRKSVRVVVYEGEQRIHTIREQVGGKGYASGFAGLLEFVEGLLPRNEVIGTALRKEVAMFPMLAVRELVANALIHQDFFMTGVGPMIEIFDGRIEVTNPGLPLVKTDRFLDSPPRSRNEALASFMRRVGI